MGAFHTRGEAGLRTPNGGALRGKKRLVVVHHTASDGEPDGFDPGRWQALERGELGRGYSSLAYHFGVTKGTGDIVEARGWGQRGAATGGTAPSGLAWNDDSYAIVLDAYCHPPPNDAPSDAALEAIADVIVLGCFLGFIAPDFEVWTHRDASTGTKWATACPGDRMAPLVRGPFGTVEARARYKLAHAGSVGVTPPPAAPSPPRCVSVASRATLRRNSSGPSVKVLQNLLLSRGFNPGAVDGRFGAKTEAAVRCFQVASGLTNDGVVGPATWAALGA